MKTLTLNEQNMVTNTIKEYFTMAENIYTYPYWYNHTISWDTGVRGKTAGEAHYSSKGNHLIKLNEILLKDNFQHFLNDTIPHEVAHIIAFIIYGRNIHHGKEWKNIMRDFGVNPTRCHNLDTSKVQRNTKRFEWICDCKKRYVSTRKHNKLLSSLIFTSYTCKTCKQPITYSKKQTDVKTLAAQQAS